MVVQQTKNHARQYRNMSKAANRLTKSENAAISKRAHKMGGCSMATTTVTVSNRGYIVLPISIRKALE
jgi:hypothetical protein